MLFLIIIIFIIFYISNRYLFKKEEKEHFLTWFLPFYDVKLNKLSNFYNNNDNNLNYFKKKFIFDPIIFNCITIDKKFISTLISNYISKSYLNNIQIILNNDIIKNLYDLVDNKINYFITEYSIIDYYNNILKKDIDKIKLVTNLYRLYFYFFTKKKYKVYSLNEIPPDFIIGTIDYPNPFYLCFYKIMKDLGYNIKTDFKVKKYKNLNDLLEGFSNSECNMIIFYDVFPNKTINSFLNKNIFDDIILLPFYITNEDLFLKKNKNIKIDYIDLNKLSNSYLPKNFDMFRYNTYKPDFKICYTNTILITNIKSNNEYTYDFIKFYFNNYKIINNSTDEGYTLYKTDISNTYEILDYHQGVLNFLYSKGFITTNNNPNCKYLTGSLECNNKNLENNNLL